MYDMILYSHYPRYDPQTSDILEIKTCPLEPSSRVLRAESHVYNVCCTHVTSATMGVLTGPSFIHGMLSFHTSRVQSRVGYAARIFSTNASPSFFPPCTLGSTPH